MYIKFFKWWYNRGLGRSTGSWNDLICGITDIYPKSFQFSEELPFIHDRRTGMLDQSGRNIIIGVAVMCLKSPVQVLGYAFCTFRKCLFVLVGLRLL